MTYVTATVWIMDTRCTFKVVKEYVFVRKLDNVRQCNFQTLMIALILFVSPRVVTGHLTHKLEKLFLPFAGSKFEFEFIACSLLALSHTIC